MSKHKWYTDIEQPEFGIISEICVTLFGYIDHNPRNCNYQQVHRRIHIIHHNNIRLGISIKAGNYQPDRSKYVNKIAIACEWLSHEEHSDAYIAMRARQIYQRLNQIRVPAPSSFPNPEDEWYTDIEQPELEYIYKQCVHLSNYIVTQMIVNYWQVYRRIESIQRNNFNLGMSIKAGNYHTDRSKYVNKIVIACEWLSHAEHSDAHIANTARNIYQRMNQIRVPAPSSFQNLISFITGKQPTI